MLSVVLENSNKDINFPKNYYYDHNIWCGHNKMIWEIWTNGYFFLIFLRLISFFFNVFYFFQINLRFLSVYHPERVKVDEFSYVRLEVPARGNECRHRTVFDLKSFLQLKWYIYIYIYSHIFMIQNRSLVATPSLATSNTFN